MEEKKSERAHQSGWTLRLIFIISSAFLVIPALSISLVSLNSPSDLIKDFMNQTQYKRTGEPMSQSQMDSDFGLLTAVLGAGALVGTITSSSIGDRCGRKTIIGLSLFVGGVGVLLMSLCRVCSAHEMLFVGRALVGIGFGWGMTQPPAYAMEICPASLKSATGVANQMSQSTAILFAQILGYQELLGNDEYWDILLGVPLVLLVLGLVSLAFLPESPRFLLVNRRNDEGARRALQKIYEDKDVEFYMSELVKEQQESSTEAKVSILGLFRSKVLRRPLLIIAVVGTYVNWCGMSTIIYFCTEMFRDAGITGKKARYATSGTGIVLFLGNMVASFLVPRCGRKMLFISGTAGIAISMAILPFTLLYKDEVEGLKYASIVVSMVIVASFSLGPVSVFWVLLGEIFPHSARAAAYSVFGFINFLGFFTHNYALPVLQGAVGSFCFFVFTVFDIVVIIFIAVYMPETLNKSFPEVAATWMPKGEWDIHSEVTQRLDVDMELTVSKQSENTRDEGFS